jgi:glycosyltransferase involved in cell wall biosynthesis
MIKVCHISTVHQAFDDRIFYKECHSLVKAGFDVSLVVTHEKEETVNGVKIIPLPKSKGRLHRMIVKSHFAFYRSLKTKSKIYHFHDPELLFVGVLLSLLGKKVVYDSHENVSKQIESKAYIKPAFLRSFISKGYRLIERICISFFSSVVSVTPEIVSFLSVKKGLLLRNFPIISLIDEAKKQEKLTQKKVIFYAGGLSKIRGIKEVCLAVRNMEMDVELQLAGPWESEEYKQTCLTIEKDKVNYLGVFPMEKVYPMMKAADIGLATLYPVKNYLNSYPIKAFEYMACEKPIIMSNFPYWREAFNGFATFVDPYSPRDIQKQIEILLADPTKGKEMGERGRKAVVEKYSWEAESTKLIDLYKQLV